MTAPPLVSIVLPTYNGERYLRESVESCLRQTFPAWELILVDDASTDRTPAIIAEYMARDPRVRAVRNPTNRKLPGSLNVGFAQARGAFLTWTSDDNCYRPHALAEMVGFLQANPAVDIVYADLTVIDERGAPLGPGPVCPWAGPLEQLPFRNVVGACFLYRRAVQERLGGYAEDLALVEDYDFWLRASVEFRLARLEKDLYLYRWHPQSLTLRHCRWVQLAFERCLARNLPRMTWLPHGVRARAYQELVYPALSRLDRLAGLSFLLKALGSDPARMARWGLATLPYLLLPVPLYKLLRGGGPPCEWLRRLHLTSYELGRLIPWGAEFILADEAQLGADVVPGRRALPFLEKDGVYWGAPADDETAIRECERLRRSGANFLVFAWPAFWWLEYYAGFHRHLRSNFRRALENDRVVVFDLRG
jgi:hypothetical protein